jgi:hypothetical protein
MLPEIWRGNNYVETRLLLLGESAYSWIEGGEIIHPSERHAVELVEEVIERFPSNRFMNSLSRALASEECPAKECLERVWARVAFTNYVSGTVGIGARIEPSAEMWQAARATFPDLLNALRPKNIIVLGKRMWDEMPLTDIWLTDDVQAYKISDSEIAMCWVLQHPSAGLSWRRLANIIDFACERKIDVSRVACRS